MSEYYDRDTERVLEVESSDSAIGAILSLKRKGRQVTSHRFPFEKKIYPAEMNYSIHDKELIAIVDSLLQWRMYSPTCYLNIHEAPEPTKRYNLQAHQPQICSLTYKISEF